MHVATLDSRPAKVYYLVPEYRHPSWGVGLLRRHVHLLKRNAIDAEVVLRTPPRRRFWQRFRPSELSLGRFRPRPHDVLVVPEVMAGDEALAGLNCRRVVLVQGSFAIVSGLRDGRDYKALGYEQAMVILPHMKPIVEQHFGIEARLVRPFIAPYFFQDPASRSSTARKKRILTYPKALYLEAGLPDYQIVWRLLRRRIEKAHRDWEIVALAEKSHESVARWMRTSAFLVNVNSHEGFNTTVPEAMAAGCIAVCYDAFGGQDFLRDGHNAFVFPNHHVYPLLDRLFTLIDGYDRLQDELDRIRSNAYATADQYTESETERELSGFFRSFLATP